MLAVITAVDQSIQFFTAYMSVATPGTRTGDHSDYFVVQTVKHLVGRVTPSEEVNAELRRQSGFFHAVQLFY
jgi:hypothetical protein